MWIIHFRSMSKFLSFFSSMKCIMLKYCVVFSLISAVGKSSYKLLEKHFSMYFSQCIDHQKTSADA